MKNLLLEHLLELYFKKLMENKRIKKMNFWKGKSLKLKIKKKYQQEI